jgi:hypothetical protein
MEGPSALYAAQRFARWLSLPQEPVRIYGADHEQITAHLRSAREGLRSALRGGGEARLLVGGSSTKVPHNGGPLNKRSANHSFAPSVHLWLAANRIEMGGIQRARLRRHPDMLKRLFAVTSVSFRSLVAPFFSRQPESKKGRTSDIVERLLRTEGLASPFGTEA